MANNLGFVAFLCGGVAFVGILVVTAFPEWLRNSQQSSEEYLRNQYVYHGIWWRCTMVKQGTFQCDNYDVSILGLPSDIQACRALMCIASIFSFIGLMASLLSLDCTTMVEPGTKSKNRISCVAGFLFIVAADLQAQRALMVIAVMLSLFGLMTGLLSLRCTSMVENDTKAKSYVGVVAGSLFLLAGVCCGGAVSWYAWRVTMEFFNPYYSQREFKYEYGACLYGGWVSMFLGACTMTATVWFGIQVSNQFYDPLNQKNPFKYEYGSCLYVGWICASLTLVSGLILTCAACRDLREDSRDSYQPSYSYKPPVSKSVKPPSNKTEYV